MSLLVVICYKQTTKDIPSHYMVIVTNYELIENPQTGFFMLGVQNLSLVPAAAMILKLSAVESVARKLAVKRQQFILFAGFAVSIAVKSITNYQTA